MAKSVNYSPELTASIIEQYEAGVDVATIAADIDKSVRSVRSSSSARASTLPHRRRLLASRMSRLKRDAHRIGITRTVSGRGFHGSHKGGYQ